MKFTIVTVGKIRENFIFEGIKDYHLRISRYTQLDLFPVKEERITPGLTETLILQ
jgi:23S rRNA (pseudouridine1915-N3)-methyltransferase